MFSLHASSHIRHFKLACPVKMHRDSGYHRAFTWHANLRHSARTYCTYACPYLAPAFSHLGSIWARHAFHFIRHDITIAKWADDVSGGEVNEEQLGLTYNDILLKWNSSNGNYTLSKTDQTLNGSKFVTGNWRTEMKTDWKSLHVHLVMQILPWTIASCMLEVCLLCVVRYQILIPSRILPVLWEKISEEFIFKAQVWLSE